MCLKTGTNLTSVGQSDCIRLTLSETWFYMTFDCQQTNCLSCHILQASANVISGLKNITGISTERKEKSHNFHRHYCLKGSLKTQQLNV